VIPYFEIKPIEIWILPPLQPFGILLAIGVLFGSYMGRRFVERYKLDEETLRWLVIRLLVWGFIACHLINTLFYEPERLVKDPLLLFKVWDGISSFGGIVGGAIAFFYYTRNFDKMNRMRWSDMVAYGLVPGFMFGRIGCAIVHDHIGVETDFPLAVNFPKHVVNGTVVEGPHHDLGLYEVPLLFAIWIVILLLGRNRNRPDGIIAAFTGVAYAVPRFFLEFLRLDATDPRHFGVTPAQVMAILMAVAGMWVFYKIYVRKEFTRASEPEEHKLEPPQRGKRAPRPGGKKKSGKPSK
jgi:phosphatidylglycerol:prolipoprotein diacylglycerol transferase